MNNAGERVKCKITKCYNLLFMGGVCIAGIMIANLLLYVRFFMYTAVVNLLPAYLLSKAIADLFIGGVCLAGIMIVVLN